MAFARVAALPLGNAGPKSSDLIAHRAKGASRARKTMPDIARPLRNFGTSKGGSGVRHASDAALAGDAVALERVGIDRRAEAGRIGEAEHTTVELHRLGHHVAGHLQRT